MITRQNLIPSFQLLLSAIFWGFGFIATVWALPTLSPAAIIFYRFIVCFFIGLFSLYFFPLRGKALINEFKLSGFSGLSLGLCLFLQTWGLLYTTATNSAFITTLYVVMVPLLAKLFLKEKLYSFHWFFVFLAIVGTALIVQLGHISLNKGDLLTLACAFAASIQIVYVSWIADRTQQPFIFNTFQSFWAAVPFLLFLPLELEADKWNIFNLDTLGWIGMLSLIFGSTLLGFYFQIKAQQKLSSSLASLIFLLESPFSCLFAIYFLSESITLLQFLGAIMIFSSCALAVWFEELHKSKLSVSK
jgi:drug/metabolite transporter (DMT)-like permease